MIVERDALRDQVFIGPLFKMLHYKGLTLDDPQVKEWIKEKIETSKQRNYSNADKSTRIIRSLAKKLGMNGETSESSRTREFCIFVYDYLVESKDYFLIHCGICEGDRHQAYHDFLVPALRYFLPIIQSSIGYYSSGFILKSGLSYIDIVIAEQLILLDSIDKLILQKYPKLLQYVHLVCKMISSDSSN